MDLTAQGIINNLTGKLKIQNEEIIRLREQKGSGALDMTSEVISEIDRLRQDLHDKTFKLNATSAKHDNLEAQFD